MSCEAGEEASEGIEAKVYWFGACSCCSPDMTVSSGRQQRYDMTVGVGMLPVLRTGHWHRSTLVGACACTAATTCNNASTCAATAP